EKGKKLSPGQAFPKELQPKAFAKGSQVFVGAVSDWFREQNDGYSFLSAPSRTVETTGLSAPDPWRHQSNNVWLSGTVQALNSQLFGVPYGPIPPASKAPGIVPPATRRTPEKPQSRPAPPPKKPQRVSVR